MKNIYTILCCLCSVWAVAQDARSIVEKADEKIRGKSSHVRMSIQTIRPEWTRTMEIEAWMKGTDLSLIRILAPAKEKGSVGVVSHP